jgi:hypothetical protein
VRNSSTCWGLADEAVAVEDFPEADALRQIVAVKHVEEVAGKGAALSKATIPAKATGA